MRVLVTGATGFVGDAVFRSLVARGHDPVAITRPGSHFQGNRLTWDIANNDSPPVPKNGFQAVIHLAQSRVYQCFPSHARAMFDVNVLGTQRVLEFAVAARACRFCLASSGTVYQPFTGRLREDAPLSPSNYLGASKLAAEAIARPYQKLMSLCVLRLFQPYGPGQTDRLFPRLIERVRSKCPIIIGNDGEGARLAPTFVDDIASVILAAIEEDWQGIFNVAAPIDLSIRDIAETIGRLVGIAPVFEYSPGTSMRIVPDLSKLAGRYPLARFSSLEAGLEKTLIP